MGTAFAAFVTSPSVVGGPRDVDAALRGRDSPKRPDRLPVADPRNEGFGGPVPHAPGVPGGALPLPRAAAGRRRRSSLGSGTRRRGAAARHRLSPGRGPSTTRRRAVGRAGAALRPARARGGGLPRAAAARPSGSTGGLPPTTAARAGAPVRALGQLSQKCRGPVFSRDAGGRGRAAGARADEQRRNETGHDLYFLHSLSPDSSSTSRVVGAC